MRGGARRAAAIVVMGYLAATLPLFWRGPWGPSRAAFAALHVAAIASLWWSQPAGRHRRTVLTDWLPLLLVPFLYAELPWLMGDGGYHDAVVRVWEAAIFGGQPARTLAGALPPSVALSELLHLGYLLYYPIVYAPPLLLYLSGNRDAFGRTMLAVMLTYAVCFLVFAVFPVEGPRYAWGAPPGVPDGFVRSLAVGILERGSSRGTAFPSSHAAVAAAQAVAALRYQPRVGVVVAATSVVLMTGAVYGGFHYAVDVVAGAVVGCTIALAVGAWWGRANRHTDGHLRRPTSLANFTRP